MAEATLILLAGGRSTRYGRPKQLEPVGPNGEAILDITVSDAFACGCSNVVLVVRPEHEALFAERFAQEHRLSMVVQHEALGTAHAVMIAIEGCPCSVVVANGDDHYGRASIALAFAAAQGNSEEHALVAFRLANTLSKSGGVNRAICKVDTKGALLSTEEVLGLFADEQRRIHDAMGRYWKGDELVSMNLWMLRPSVFPLFSELFDRSLHGLLAEFGLPMLVDAALAQGHRFRILPTNSEWCGLTYPRDAELVRRMLAERP